MRYAQTPLRFIILSFALLAPSLPAAEPKSESDKIKSLIASIETLKDATFIRNGSSHTAAEAADHLRRKWDSGKDKIKTARDFITHAASKSSLTGQPYKIRYKDRTEVTAEKFLSDKLNEMEK